MTLGERLRILRNSKRYKQEEIAAMLEINRVTYTNIETNLRQPSIDNLVKLSKIYEMTIDEIIFGTKPVETNKIPSIRIITRISFNSSGYLNDVAGYRKHDIPETFPDDYFIFRAESKSIEGDRIRSGHEILFKETNNLEFDSLVFAIIDKTQPVIGWLYKENNVEAIILPEYFLHKPIVFTKKNIQTLEIIGVAIEGRYELNDMKKFRR